MTHQIAPQELYALLKPYEDYQRGHTFNGPNTYIDIAHGVTNSCSASIRRVSAEGVEIFFDSRCEMVSFDAIKRVTIRTADLYNTLATTRYEVDAALAQQVAA